MTDDLRPPGSRIGPFEVEDTAGSGSSAVVYRARLVSMFDRDDYPTRVALKLFTRLDDEQRATVLNEFGHARRHPSPYLATMYTPIELGDEVALVYELADHTLRDRLRDVGPLSGAELDELLHDLTMGLHALHAQHTIHSDVKPANVLRVGDRWKLTDLGAATRFDIGSDDTVAVLRAYNRPYLSPELTRQLGDPASAGELLTRRSDDMWALGITLFEAATGVHPFVQSEVRSATELHDVTIPASLYRSDHDLSVGAVIETCLDPIPERRWASAVMLKGLLYPHESASDEPVRGASPDSSQPTVHTSATPDREHGHRGIGEGPAAASPRPARRRRVAGAAVAALALAGAAGIARSRGSDSSGSAGPNAATTTASVGTTIAAVDETLASPAPVVPETSVAVDAAVSAASPSETTASPPASAGPADTVPDPEAPVQIGPIGAVDSRTPTYRWEAVPDAQYYLVWVNEDADPFVGGKVNQGYTPAEAGCPDGTGVCSVTPTVEILRGGEWWVTVWKSDQVQHVSPGTKFTTV